MSELKPCPFCGGEAYVSNGVPRLWYVHCPECIIDGPINNTEAKAIEAWNHRAQPAQAETGIHEAQGQIEFLDKKNNALLAAIRKVMARLADLLDEDQFKEIEEIVSFAGVQPQAEAVPSDVVRDAERWRMLPAYFYEYQIDAMKLYRDIDAAIAQQKGGV